MDRAKKEWMMAFLFGFIHGFGFANALKDMELNVVNVVKMLFGFNLGVEIGQLIFLVAIFFPLRFLVRRLVIVYDFLIFVGVLFSLIWIHERLPF